MNPLALLSLIQLGASLIGGFRAQQEAARQAALAEAAMNRQAQAGIDALNAALAFANRDITSALTPQYSALQGRALADVAGTAAASGLTGSGLAAAAQMGVRSDISAALAQRLLEWEQARIAPLMQAQAGLANIFGSQAQMRGALMQHYAEMGPNLEWLPKLLQAKPDLFNLNIDLSWLASLFGGGVGGGTPGQPQDNTPINPIV